MRLYLASPSAVRAESMLTVCGPTTIFPEVDVKTGTRLMSRRGPSMASHGTQMLYEAPICDSLKCCVNCSGVNTNLRSGAR